MVHIICTKNDSILTNKYSDMVLGGEKVWIDRRNGRTNAQTTQKYIPLLSSVDIKQAKSNGNIDLKKQQQQKKLIQQFIEHQNN